MKLSAISPALAVVALARIAPAAGKPILSARDRDAGLQCDRAAFPDRYVIATYANGEALAYGSGECYSYELEGGSALKTVEFCATVTCYNYLDAHCSGQPQPSVGGVLVEGVTLGNPLSFMSLVGKGAICYKGDDGW